MKIILKNLRIFDKQTPDHLTVKDILIENGIITNVAAGITASADIVYDLAGYSVSAGWVDMNCHIFEPGLEYREDLKSGLKAAANGGFTSVCLMPNTHPVVDNKAQVEFVRNNSKDLLVNVLPVGAVSTGTDGKDLAEIYDMQASGAVAFSDGIHSVQNSGLLERALLYVKKFDGFVMNLPNDEQIARHGNMNEGIMSTQLGLHAAPKLAEELMVSRDIYLAEDSGSRLHFSAVSTQGAVDLIRKAKARGVKVTASVNVVNLLLDDTSLADFDTNYKVLPHLRNQEDVIALTEGLKDGTIDVISSGHLPLHVDEKKVEFDHAEFGISSLDTAFMVAVKATSGKLSEEQLIEKLAVNPYKILNIEQPSVQKGRKAVLTVYTTEGETVVAASDILSKSKNSPFIGSKLQGSVKGIVNQNQIFIK
jgi:dihydroorotase